MHRFYRASFAAAAVLAVGLVQAPRAGAEDTKELLIKGKCDMCHSASAVGMDSKKKSGAVDLSGVGKNFDAAYLADFLQKKVPHKPHDDRTSTDLHIFKVGDEAAAKALAEALAQLK